MLLSQSSRVGSFPDGGFTIRMFFCVNRIMISIIKRFFPHEWRQEMKRKLFHHQDMRSRLGNLRRAGLEPKGAVDGGAYHGNWTKEFWSVWPEVPVLMVEPQPACRQILHQLSTKVTGSEVASCALGDACGEVAFTLGETNSGIRNDEDMTAGKVIVVPLETLDSLVNPDRGFCADFLKLDLQGFELHALEGGLERAFPVSR